MKETILNLLKSESEKYTLKNKIFTLDFYKTINIENLEERVNLIETTYGREYSQELFDKFYQIAINQHKATTPVTIQESSVLKVNANKWLVKYRQNEIGWNNDEVGTYRERYFAYLKKIGRSENIINETRRSTLNIIESLGDPESNEEFYKKGMVVGSVQSGKTANFNGVINTAIDAGYKMVIVLSGIMEDLRVQTQIRIEKEVIGPLGAGNVGVGVGKEYPFHNNFVSSVTSQSSDFNRSLLNADFNIHNKNILVIKKNVHILKNILLWLNESVSDEYPKITVPLLIIDDECDNASLNNIGHKGDEYASKTNAEIRAILALFSKKSYLGYTATPFANVFQDRNESPTSGFKLTHRETEYNFNLVDNLFPDHFIEMLQPPSNYVGIKHFFDTKSDEINKIESLIARPIDFDNPEYYKSIPPRFRKDSDPIYPELINEPGTRAAKKDDNYPNEENGIPKSLQEAIHCFILSIAIRDSRKEILINSPFYQRHHTMLVHISLFGPWQNRLKGLSEEYVKKLTNDLNHDSLDADVFKEFERIWIKHFEYIVNNIQHELPKDYIDDYLVPKDYNRDIKPLLIKAIENIEVVAINSYTKTDLNYKNEDKKYIAIGGNRLSRGFTLEGLTINYFLRKANTADTLMQMGRWFGYRIGYLDCCKLFTTSENIDKFNEASEIIEDLENKFKYLSDLPGRTPSDFTLWVKNNPDVIKLTRANFLKDLTRKNLSFEDTVQQSTQFLIDKEKIKIAYDFFKLKFSKIEWKQHDSQPNFIVYDTDQNGLMEFINLPNTMLNFNILGLKEYLEICLNSNKLKNWRIAINISKGNTGSPISLNNKKKTYTFNKVTRSGPSIRKDTKNPSLSYNSLVNKDVFKARSSTIISPGDFSLCLTKEQKNLVNKNYKEKQENESGNNKFKTVPDREYRSHMDASQGLLVIYLMDLDKVFNVKGNEENSNNLSLKNYAKQKGLDETFQKSTPLIGYALGFPTNVGVNGADYVTQHVHKEPENMNLDELKKFISERDFDIDVNNNDWTVEGLLEAISDNPGNDEIESLKDIEEISVEIN
ncbi:Z1 domain-containing protein [Tenacibaculum finnmarkense]|uniref:Z1 domain-containing protein n=1 Tax=Tenacibaculum finnmarkense TaxID=2781243 RepID=UPI001E5E7B41|nr:Z1 domain-containing protein [Tenacibaculum finnmarkense]MCD8409895.1 Z1 domain-containing protein [Tenacibaculum finnmarkense genomovar ulcerans]